jgi:hypothetical protein
MWRERARRKKRQGKRKRERRERLKAKDRGAERGRQTDGRHIDREGRERLKGDTEEDKKGGDIGEIEGKRQREGNRTEGENREEKTEGKRQRGDTEDRR